ncbi:hypothetical protein FVE85_3619 [Porphyridium purpureum]|uniref:Uncharacterized protein n=1 Tax=Porphyridium purpureum TaxID=35688 RepID=A0A5J4YL20_PORPP|nr:hypothetical protein FVE85_3619 [Porphyridium purpureum]|eukprot:POR4510..scf249_10
MLAPGRGAGVRGAGLAGDRGVSINLRRLYKTHIQPHVFELRTELARLTQLRITLVVISVLLVGWILSAVFSRAPGLNHTVRSDLDPSSSSSSSGSSSSSSKGSSKGNGESIRQGNEREASHRADILAGRVDVLVDVSKHGSGLYRQDDGRLQANSEKQTADKDTHAQKGRATGMDSDKRGKRPAYMKNANGGPRLDEIDDYDLWTIAHASSSASSAAASSKKVVALVELRNVRHMLPFWMSALAMITDAVVALDDVSTDGTVEWLLENGAAFGIERIIAKREPWVLREELRDRNLLLHEGRLAQGSHFILLDYDEVVSYPCAKDNIFLSVVKELNPGEFLILPWVELWRTSRTARVKARGDAPESNFLNRKQIVVFADIPGTMYTAENTMAHTFQGSNASDQRTGSIHVRRCPTSICNTERSGMHSFPSTGTHGLAKPKATKVKSKDDIELFRLGEKEPAVFTPSCVLIEMRFMSLENVLLKSAWYELLEKYMGNARSNTAHGKMMDTVHFATGSRVSAPVYLAAFAGDQLLHPYPGFHEELYKNVELWRAHELYNWASSWAALSRSKTPTLASSGSDKSTTMDQTEQREPQEPDQSAATPTSSEVFSFFSGGSSVVDMIDWPRLQTHLLLEAPFWVEYKQKTEEALGARTSTKFVPRHFNVPHGLRGVPLHKLIIVESQDTTGNLWAAELAQILYILSLTNPNAMVVVLDEDDEIAPDHQLGKMIHEHADCEAWLNSTQAALSFEDRRFRYEQLITQRIQDRRNALATNSELELKASSLGSSDASGGNRASVLKNDTEIESSTANAQHIIVIDVRPGALCEVLDVAYEAFRDVDIKVVKLTHGPSSIKMSCRGNREDTNAAPAGFASTMQCSNSLARSIMAYPASSDHIRLVSATTDSLLSLLSTASLVHIINATVLPPLWSSLSEVHAQFEHLQDANLVFELDCSVCDRWSELQGQLSIAEAWLRVLRILECVHLAIHEAYPDGAVPSTEWRADQERGVLQSRNAKRQVPSYPHLARLIFSLNVGRSGSKYLSGLLGSVQNPVLSEHEVACPNRLCTSGGALGMQTKLLNESFGERSRIKLPLIRAGLLALVGRAAKLESCLSSNEVVEISYCELSHCQKRCYLRDAVYSETNPNFKSWFYDVVFEHFARSGLGYQVQVITLRKYIPAVVKSLYETGFFTQRRGYTWMETANSVNALLAPIAPEERLGPVEKIISYVLNAELVFSHLQQTYVAPQFAVEFMEYRSEYIYSVPGALELLEVLRLQRGAHTLQLAGKIVDKYVASAEDVKKVYKPISLYEVEQSVFDYFSKCAQLNISIAQTDFPNMAPFPRFEYHQY